MAKLKSSLNVACAAINGPIFLRDIFDPRIKGWFLSEKSEGMGFVCREKSAIHLNPIDVCRNRVNPTCGGMFFTPINAPVQCKQRELHD